MNYAQPCDWGHSWMILPRNLRTQRLVVCRAGASTQSRERPGPQLPPPCLILHSPNVAGDHQRKNAIAVVSKGAADMLHDETNLDREARRADSSSDGQSTEPGRMQTPTPGNWANPRRELRIAQAILPPGSHPHPENPESIRPPN